MTPTFPIPYIENALRFTEEGIDCKGDTWQRGCAAADGEPAFAVHTIDGKHYCPYHSPFDNIYVPCTRCGERPVNKPASLEIDPVCMTCQREMHGRKLTVKCRSCGNNFEAKKLSDRHCDDCLGCPGFDDSCDNLRSEGKKFCEDCEEKREAQSGTTFFATVVKPNGCPGWGPGEGECGNPKLEGSDLCGDCHGARLDYESPYPGNHRKYPC